MYMGLMMLGRQTYIHTTEPLVPETIVLEVEMVIENLNRHKSPGIDKS